MTKSITGKPKQHLIPHLIQCPKVAPDVHQRAKAQKAAWAEADTRKVAAWPASLQNNSIIGPSQLIIPMPHSESPALSPLLLSTFPPTSATLVNSPILSEGPLK